MRKHHKRRLKDRIANGKVSLRWGIKIGLWRTTRITTRIIFLQQSDLGDFLGPPWGEKHAELAAVEMATKQEDELMEMATGIEKVPPQKVKGLIESIDKNKDGGLTEEVHISDD